MIVGLAEPHSCNTYSYWAENQWKLTDRPLEIVDPNSKIYLRLSHVTFCVDGPGPRPRTKRRLSSATTPSPVRIRTENDLYASVAFELSDCRDLLLSSAAHQLVHLSWDPSLLDQLPLK
jgi:hypothetical protein